MSMVLKVSDLQKILISLMRRLGGVTLKKIGIAYEIMV